MSANPASPIHVRIVPESNVGTPKRDVGFTASLLSMLDEVETWIHRMLLGIWHFLVTTLPKWAVRQLCDFCRVAVKMVRVATILSVWIAVVFWPLLFMQTVGGWIFKLSFLAWVVLNLAGSVWGIRFVRRRRAWSRVVS